VGTGIAALVARLRELKDQGWDFDAAWKRALEDCPVDVRREFAIRERQVVSLFDPDEAPRSSSGCVACAVTRGWMRRRCWAARPGWGC
jgi:hypothetical protein